MNLSVFVPIFNEADVIVNNINSLYKELKKLPYKFEMVIVDDGSKDNSKDLVNNLNIKELVYCYYSNGPSRRENLADAFKKAKGDTIVFIDSDLSTDLIHLTELIEYTKKFEIVTGSRYLPGSIIKRTKYRKTVSFMYNQFIRLYFGSKIYDHQCGFKAFKKDKLLLLLDEMGYDKSLSRGWFWDAELLIRAQKNSFLIKEFPIKWKHGDKSTFNIKREIRMLPYVFLLKFKLGNR